MIDFFSLVLKLAPSFSERELEMGPRNKIVFFCDQPRPSLRKSSKKAGKGLHLRFYSFRVNHKEFVISVKVKSSYKSSGSSGRSLSRFLQHEATKGISTPL